MIYCEITLIYPLSGINGGDILPASEGGTEGQIKVDPTSLTAFGP